MSKSNMPTLGDCIAMRVPIENKYFVSKKLSKHGTRYRVRIYQVTKEVEDIVDENFDGSLSIIYSGRKAEVNFWDRINDVLATPEQIAVFNERESQLAKEAKSK